MYSILKDIKILDLSRLLPGALCSMMLADMGAEVLKVEDTSQGDYMRWMPPMVNELSAYFLLTNRNKKSMKLDLKAPKGKEIFLKLVKQYDVVLESFRPGVMDRLGLGYEVLRKENPGIVYCALSGYGQDGPYRDLVGHDINYIALGGILSSTGTEEGKPTIPSIQIADIGVGSLMSSIGILSALMHQRATGKGLFVDVSMLDGVVFWMHLAFAEFFTTGKLPKPGNEMLTGKFPCYNVYETKDKRYIAIGALEAKFWATLCTAVKRPDLIEHQYATGTKREEVIGELRRIFEGKDKDEWVALFGEHDICFAPVSTLDEVYKDGQLMHREMFFEMDHPTDGRIKQIKSPLKYVGAGKKQDVPAPAYGRHTEDILRDLGYTDQSIERFHEEGVI
jgi:crotonobetainyl-CoA:carnitine CoA-transferase CaiB-like acyl-CoA transferase